MPTLNVLFLQILVVVGLPVLLWKPLGLGRVFPLPIIQIFAGIVLGPSVFGAVLPDAFAFLFRREALVSVGTLADIATVLFVFLAGCDADRTVLRTSAGMVLRVGAAGVFVPWILGGCAAYALALTDGHAAIVGPSSGPMLFSVAFGLCVAVTALPVLAIVLRELGFHDQPVGTIALALAGVGDALLWGAIAVLLPFSAGLGSVWVAFAAALAGTAALVCILRLWLAPLIARLVDRGAEERLVLSAVLLTVFLAALVTDTAGLHSVLGAFLAGLFLPEGARRLAHARLDVPVALLLLPFLFLSTGLKTHFSFADPVVWIVLAVAAASGICGKFAGVSIPAALSGERPAFATMLGVLMQCRGLMEIVVVTVLYQENLIGSATFSALILFALISTALTIPGVRLVQRLLGDDATRAAIRA
jgi:Kef-type K+ transport system membrane component KefB